MSVSMHKQQNKHQVSHKNNRTIFYGSNGVAACKKVWHQRFSHHIAGQPDRIGYNRIGGFNRVFGQKLAMLKQQADNRLRQNNQQNRSRKRKQQAIFNSLILSAAGFIQLLLLKAFRKNRQQSHADSRTDNTKRQLLQAIGIIKPRNSSGADQRN